MSKDFLYCEETDTKIRNNDVVSISTYPNVKWIVKNGWYKIGTAQKRGWYFVSIADKTVLPIDLVDIKDISKDDNQAISTSEERPTSAENPTSAAQPEVNVLYCDDTDTKIYHNDIVDISGEKYVVKFGWHDIDGQQKNDWHFISLKDRSILPLSEVDLTVVSKEQVLGTSEFRPTLKDMETPALVNDYIVIPNTDIRLYDSDIVKVSNRPNIKWVVHTGWFIYDNIQNYGWYFVSIKDGEILPVSIVDLTLVTLEVLKTQGSEVYDGKVVGYTRPFTLADAEIIRRAFITVETPEQRDNLDPKKLVNGKMVRVNDVGGVASYYAWNEETQVWDKVDFGSGGSGIPELVGTEAHPIIISKLDEGLYRIIGYYKISPSDGELQYTDIDHITFTSNNGDVTQIKVITESNIIDYNVEDDEVTFSNEYATKFYVDSQITLIEQQISEIISELPSIIDARIADRFEPISDTFIRGLFGL